MRAGCSCKLHADIGIQVDSSRYKVAILLNGRACVCVCAWESDNDFKISHTLSCLQTSCVLFEKQKWKKLILMLFLTLCSIFRKNEGMEEKLPRKHYI